MSQPTAAFDTHTKDWDKFADAIEQFNPFVYLQAHFRLYIGIGVLILFFVIFLITACHRGFTTEDDWRPYSHN